MVRIIIYQLGLMLVSRGGGNAMKRTVAILLVLAGVGKCDASDGNKHHENKTNSNSRHK